MVCPKCKRSMSDYPQYKKYVCHYCDDYETHYQTKTTGHIMKNRADYSKYKCPYLHIEKDCGHKLHGPEGYEKTYGVWCACGFRGPVFCLEPEDLRLKKFKSIDVL